LSFPKRPNKLWGPPILLFNAYRRSFLGVKQPGRETDHAPAYIAEVKNEWCHTSTPTLYSWRGQSYLAANCEASLIRSSNW